MRQQPVAQQGKPGEEPGELQQWPGHPWLREPSCRRGREERQEGRSSCFVTVCLSPLRVYGGGRRRT